jgi:hypothetical protein
MENSAYCRWITAVGLTTKPVGKPGAGNPHVRFDERDGPSHRAHPRLYHHGQAAFVVTLQSTLRSSRIILSRTSPALVGVLFGELGNDHAARGAQLANDDGESAELATYDDD